MKYLHKNTYSTFSSSSSRYYQVVLLFTDKEQNKGKGWLVMYFRLLPHISLVSSCPNQNCWLQNGSTYGCVFVLLHFWAIVKCQVLQEGWEIKWIMAGWFFLSFFFSSYLRAIGPLLYSLLVFCQWTLKSFWRSQLNVGGSSLCPDSFHALSFVWWCRNFLSPALFGLLSSLAHSHGIPEHQSQNDSNMNTVTVGGRGGGRGGWRDGEEEQGEGEGEGGGGGTERDRDIERDSEGGREGKREREGGREGETDRQTDRERGRERGREGRERERLRERVRDLTDSDTHSVAACSTSSMLCHNPPHHTCMCTYAVPACLTCWVICHSPTPNTHTHTHTCSLTHQLHPYSSTHTQTCNHVHT